LRSFQDQLPEFTKRGIKVVAISVDPPATTRQHLARTGWTYTFLSDPEAKAIKAYDLVHPVGENMVIARPAEFLVDPTGTVRWRDLTEDLRVRTRPEKVLEVFDSLAGQPHALAPQAPSMLQSAVQ
jgi:peroxiredoxin